MASGLLSRTVLAVEVAVEVASGLLSRTVLVVAVAVGLGGLGGSFKRQP